jgi:hypothetical protein
MTYRLAYPHIAVIATATLLATSLARLNAQQRASEAVSIGDNDIGGVVRSTKGAEAGVWVIAETNDLPTKFAKIVVTDYDGRYVVPQLPKANYKMWVRGYGLIDSQPIQGTPGKTVNLTAEVAPNPRAAAEYYPAVYWFSLLRVPDKGEFPGTGPKGNGLPENMKHQGQWLHLLKTDSCWSCHQVGDKATREIPKSLGHFDSTKAAWTRRVQSGQAGSNMIGGLAQMGPDRTLSMLADWTDRIAAGELPPVPPRPQGMERNVVITEWDWQTPKRISTMRSPPTSGTPHSTPTGWFMALPNSVRIICRSSIPWVPQGVKSRCRFAIRKHLPARTTNRWRLRRTGGMKSSGTAKPTCTIQCSMGMDACGSLPESARATIRPSAKKGRAILRLLCFR